MFDSFDINADGHIGTLVDYAAAITDFDTQRVEEDHGVELF
ncbi:hypothetical protein FRC0024_02105 [Corynebacterium diphtheriae]|nr:hypothetical protein FRC0024_02105 [Corynebacterium diphtheriae]